MSEKLYVIDAEGKHREAIKVKCSFCEKEFLRDKRHLRPKMFCNNICKHENYKYSRVTHNCSTCGKEFTRQKSDDASAKHGYYFCTRTCKEKAQSFGGIKDIQPNHYLDGKTIYRKLALKHYGKCCSICGYKKVKVLEVHHRDSNRQHNNIENLDVLCPTHHKEYQVGILKY